MRYKKSIPIEKGKMISIGRLKIIIGLSPKEQILPKFECYEMHAYSRFAGCTEQCKECLKKHKNV